MAVTAQFIRVSESESTVGVCHCSSSSDWSVTRTQNKAHTQAGTNSDGDELKFLFTHWHIEELRLLLYIAVHGTDMALTTVKFH